MRTATRQASIDDSVNLAGEPARPANMFLSFPRDTGSVLVQSTTVSIVCTALTLDLDGIRFSDLINLRFKRKNVVLIVHRVLKGWITAAAITFCMVTSAGATDAKSISVFAVGASNTNGKGVGSDQAWPAVLERMLRAKGYAANVTVSAVNGDTSAGALSRTNSIPAGTQVVVFDTGGDNDRLRGISEAQINANRAQIISIARAHGAVAIQAAYRKIIGPQHSGGVGYQADEIHLTASSHARVAAYLLPQVIAATQASHR